MHSISRRGFVISAAAAAAAFGLDGPLEFMTPAFAQKATKDVVKFKVGDIEVIQMYDGIWEKAHDPGFVKNASLDEVKAALKAGGLTDVRRERRRLRGGMREPALPTGSLFCDRR